MIKNYAPQKVIYTLYKTNPSDEEVYKSVLNNKKIKIVTMFGERFSKNLTDSLHKIGVEVFVHTINDPQKAKEYLSEGADGIYSDYY